MRVVAIGLCLLSVPVVLLSLVLASFEEQGDRILPAWRAAVILISGFFCAAFAGMAVSGGSKRFLVLAGFSFVVWMLSAFDWWALVGDEE